MLNLELVVHQHAGRGIPIQQHALGFSLQIAGTVPPETWACRGNPGQPFIGHEGQLRSGDSFSSAINLVVPINEFEQIRR
jgi:hypothetical protein